MMELGSEYHLSLSALNYQEDNIFAYLSGFDQVFWFDSGRSALRHIAAHMKTDDEILLPAFICESVSGCFPPEKTRYYHLNSDFTVDLDDLKRKTGDRTRLIFVMHYFGAIQPRKVLEETRQLAEQYHCVVVEDTTHSIFSRQSTIGDYMVCSIRKWLPIPRGGVLYYASDSKRVHGANPLALFPPAFPKSVDNRRVYAMVLKDLFLHEGLDYNADYRRIFAECENLIDEQKDIGMMSDFARFIASCVSIESLQQRRSKNYDQLSAHLALHGIKPAIALSDSDTPLVFPLRVKQRDLFRSYLMNQKIYCAVHWPFDGVQPDERTIAVKNAEELISLPIDQRYDERHISYLAEMVLQYEGDLLF